MLSDKVNARSPIRGESGQKSPLTSDAVEVGYASPKFDLIAGLKSGDSAVGFFYPLKGKRRL